MSDLDSLCARAWSAVKSPTDPEHENCVGDWRRTLKNRAEAILRGESVSTLENVLARFEAKVKELGEAQAVSNYAQTFLEDVSQLSSSVTDFSDTLPSPSEVVESLPVDEQASSDARTVRNSKPTLEDDEVVSKAAKRLSKRGSAKKAKK